VHALVGQKINNYEVRSLLGEGGMGAVYLAEHPIIKTRFAIKVLHPEFMRDPEAIARFTNEARAANAIRHPNIVEIIDLGTLPDGLPYIVMELLEGESLGVRLRRLRRLPVDQAVVFAAQVANALAAAHAAGIAHRDLKPDNIFLAADPEAPERERVKVLDFGLAKLQRELPGTSISTSAGLVMGTPKYMSPEQCRGVSGDVDHRTDIYALGIILYEMVCGCVPFEAEGAGDVLMMHMTQAPRPPRTINLEVTAELNAIILRALHKHRDDRFASMAELERALLGEDAGALGVVANPVTSEESPAAWARPVRPTPARASRSSHSYGWLAGVGDVETVSRRQRRRRFAVTAAMAAAGLLGLVFLVSGSHQRRARPLGAETPAPVAPNADVTVRPTAASLPIVVPSSAPAIVAPPPAAPEADAPVPHEAAASKHSHHVRPSRARPSTPAAPPPPPAEPASKRAPSVIDQFDKLIDRPSR